jgi:rare lipoprotein A
MYKGIASYYGRDFHGKKTANGELFDMHGLSAAHRSFPFGTKVRVTNIENGKSCVVRVNDRGPFKLERIMDLSLGAAELLDMMNSGTANVTLEVLEWGE